MKSQRRIWFALGLALFFLGLGTIGYMEIEGYSFFEAVYMTVITISTVGYGEVVPLTEEGRVFTIFLILSGVGSIAFAAHAFTESMIERASNPKLRKRAMERKIKELNGHFIICGYGRVGVAAADHFQKIGRPFVVLEKSKEMLELLASERKHYVEGDATREETLLEAGIKNAGGLLALLDSDPENLFTVLTARELNPTLHIIARTEVASSESRILRAGADSVISPYTAAGKRVADRMLQGQETIGKSSSGNGGGQSQLQWQTITAKSELESHSLQAANSILGGSILGVRRKGVDFLQPTADFRLQSGDEVLVNLIEADHEVENSVVKKIVLVDDNPVICRLYTRLFQKAGFNILTAETGVEGHDLIIAEQPDAAVIDFMLPDISGLEVCKKIRDDVSMQNIKLFLFTADEQDGTREKAIAVGIDTVVVKSPDANEIVSTVKQALGK